MGYKKREWWPGVVLHITARGHHRNDIFRDEEDFKFYLELLNEAIEFFNGEFEVYSYCLMDNHVHLLVKCKEIHISSFISRVHGMYAKIFNKKYRYLGTLYQKRYFTEIIENDSQLLATSRYIHLNPVKAKMVNKPEEYKWSSYSMTIGIEKEKIINSEKILEYFQSNYKRELYKYFVESLIKNNILSEGEKDGGVSS